MAPCNMAGKVGSVVALNNNGNELPGSPFSGGGLDGAWGLAVDGNDNVWVMDWVGHHVTLLCGQNTAKCPAMKNTGDPISPETDTPAMPSRG